MGTETSIIESQAGQHRSTASVRGADHFRDGLDHAPSSTLCRVRRYSTGLLHGVRLTGTRSIARCRVCDLPLHQLWAASWVDLNFRSRSRHITTPITACISFCLFLSGLPKLLRRQHFSGLQSFVAHLR